MPETHIGRIGSPPPQNFAPTLHPEWFEGKSEQWLARVLGVTQFGVNHLTLQPGAYSALRHWHEQEDEFVFVIEGELVLIDENGEHPLRIPRHRGHGFHGMVGTNSTRRWARIPRHRGRLSIEGMVEARPTV
ncbi:MAG: cupin domain-containing protein [Phenylobacterium sp.]|nr:cupin domain-containing protein [Phenylobacterium sp.]